MTFKIILNILISSFVMLGIILITVLLSQQISKGLEAISPEQGIGLWINKIIYYGMDIILLSLGLLSIALSVAIISGKILNIK